MPKSFRFAGDIPGFNVKCPLLLGHPQSQADGDRRSPQSEVTPLLPCTTLTGLTAQGGAQTHPQEP